MGKKTLFLLGGIVLGVLVLFAVIGLQSTFNTFNQDNGTGSAAQMPYETGFNTTIKGMPEEGVVVSTMDKPVTGDEDEGKIELIDEPDMPGMDGGQADTDQNAQDQAALPEEVDDVNPPDQTAQVVIEEEPQTPPPPTATTGTLEIVVQSADSGKPVRANVYVQHTNGVNVDQQNYTTKAAFALTPGTYRITVRSQGYGSLVRNITVDSGAIVNEIFPLPAISAGTTPPRTPQTPAPTPAPEPAPAAADGRLRIAVLSADDGRPLMVDFTISRADGKVIETVDNISLTELSLPPQEYRVSFNYQGLQGSKLLTVSSGSTTSHTFNIRGVPQENTPAQQFSVRQEPPPTAQDNMQQAQPQPEQPRRIEDVLLNRLKEELEKRRE